MNSNDFIEFVGVTGDQLFINKHDIVYFRYRASRDSTEIFVRGVGEPFRFDGDKIDEIKEALNMIVQGEEACRN